MPNLSEADHAERTELGALADEIADALAPDGKGVYCFEHGAREPGSLTGCGVDQAHLHVVPLPFDLIAAARRRRDDAIAWKAPHLFPAPLDRLPHQGEYIAIWRKSDRMTLVGAVKRPTSQWVRRLIADELGISSEWNYQSHPQVMNVRTTVAMLAELRPASVR